MRPDSIFFDHIRLARKDLLNISGHFNLQWYLQMIIGGWGDERSAQTGNPFGSCAHLILRLGFFGEMSSAGGVRGVPLILGAVRPAGATPILPISLKAGLIVYIPTYIGGWGFVPAGNSFGSCASVIPRLGYFQRFVLRPGACPSSFPMQEEKQQKRSLPQGLAISAK